MVGEEVFFWDFFPLFLSPELFWFMVFIYNSAVESVCPSSGWNGHFGWQGCYSWRSYQLS